jgi:hypothetical protein
MQSSGVSTITAELRQAADEANALPESRREVDTPD